MESNTCHEKDEISQTDRGGTLKRLLLCTTPSFEGT